MGVKLSLGLIQDFRWQDDGPAYAGPAQRDSLSRFLSWKPACFGRPRVRSASRPATSAITNRFGGFLEFGRRFTLDIWRKVPPDIHHLCRCKALRYARHLSRIIRAS
jgi:hypothetical protein